MSPGHAALVGLAARHTDRIGTLLREQGWRVTHLHSTEGVIGSLQYNAADVYISAVSLPAEPFPTLVDWIRRSHSSRDAVVMAIAFDRDEERLANATSADHVVRAPRTARSLARDVILRMEIERALAYERQLLRHRRQALAV